MGILKKAWVNENDLNEMEKNNFLEHYKNNENIYILTTHEGNKINIEYKITEKNKNIYHLEATGKIIK